MAANKCYNRSSVEYKTLLNEFKSVPSVDMIIDSFQKASNNDVIPTVEDIFASTEADIPVYLPSLSTVAFFKKTKFPAS